MAVTDFVHEPVVIEEIAISQDFNNWNPFRNRYELKTKPLKKPYPRALLRAAWRECLEYADTFKIDVSFYRFARISQMEDVTWQVEFHMTEDPTGPHISIYDIYFDRKRGNIMQSCRSLGGG